MYDSLCSAVESPCIHWYAVLGEILAWSFFGAQFGDKITCIYMYIMYSVSRLVFLATFATTPYRDLRLLLLLLLLGIKHERNMAAVFSPVIPATLPLE